MSMAYPAAYAYSEDSEHISIRKVSNGFIVDMIIEAEEPYMNPFEQGIANTIINKATKLISGGYPGDDIMDKIKAEEDSSDMLGDLPPSKVKKPVTVVCLTLEEVIQKIQEQFA